MRPLARQRTPKPGSSSSHKRTSRPVAAFSASTVRFVIFATPSPSRLATIWLPPDNQHAETDRNRQQSRCSSFGEVMQQKEANSNPRKKRASHSKSVVREDVGVRVSPPAPKISEAYAAFAQYALPSGRLRQSRSRSGRGKNRLCSPDREEEGPRDASGRRGTDRSSRAASTADPEPGPALKRARQCARLSVRGCSQTMRSRAVVLDHDSLRLG